MVEKRKATTRAKGEAPAKRRASALITEEAKEPPATEPISVESVSNTLPTKISEGKHLPTLDEPQPLELSSKEYQSIAQSGVLAESLKRSRNKWLSEGIFERYWTKPSKSKNIAAPENNPDVKSMQMVGQCRLTIEPHLFDARLFIVKDPNSAKQPYKQSFPPHRPVMQYGPPNGVVVTPPLSYYGHQNTVASRQSMYQQHSSQHSHSSQQRASPATDHQSRTLPPPHTSPNLQSPHTPQPPQNQLPSHPSSQANVDHHTMGAPTANGTSSSPDQAGQNSTKAPPNLNGTTKQSTLEDESVANSSEPKPDPVIHMLAKKASSDPQLTSLMKTVASGQANEEQLKVFQQHIDELSALLAKQKAEDNKTTTSTAASPSIGAGAGQGVVPPEDGTRESSIPNGTPKPNATNSPYHPSAPIPLQPHHPTSSPAQPQAYYQSNPPLSKAKLIASPRGAEARDIAIEFERNSDRFLFPRHSILEYVPDCNVVIASFLIVRRGSSASTGHPNGKGKSHASQKGKVETQSEDHSNDVPSHPKRADSKTSVKTEPKADEDLEVDPPIYDPALDYYQPVTVRFSADDSKVLSVLRQAVAPPDEVRRYMNDIMDKMTRAEYVYLAMRLPKHDDGDVEEVNGVRDNGTPAAGDNVGKGKKVVRIE
ncbi:hypothetical protein EV356DRAFT_536467 [Viridothelium virens]|uniref:Uncharacterized protein n=1 Tax=Viridothelium virens TaxID=1048519 RepID=A0A6A6GY88_VIRVR|nr:hypothetical protein EV356DRAFT_536467 [Viridothelium virens]